MNPETGDLVTARDDASLRGHVFGGGFTPEAEPFLTVRWTVPAHDDPADSVSYEFAEDLVRMSRNDLKEDS